MIILAVYRKTKVNQDIKRERMEWVLRMEEKKEGKKKKKKVNNWGVKWDGMVGPLSDRLVPSTIEKYVIRTKIEALMPDQEM